MDKIKQSIDTCSLCQECKLKQPYKVEEEAGFFSIKNIYRNVYLCDGERQVCLSSRGIAQGVVDALNKPYADMEQTKGMWTHEGGCPSD